MSLCEYVKCSSLSGCEQKCLRERRGATINARNRIALVLISTTRRTLLLLNYRGIIRSWQSVRLFRRWLEYRARIPST